MVCQYFPYISIIIWRPILRFEIGQKSIDMTYSLLRCSPRFLFSTGNAISRHLPLRQGREDVVPLVRYRGASMTTSEGTSMILIRVSKFLHFFLIYHLAISCSWRLFRKDIPLSSHGKVLLMNPPNFGELFELSTFFLMSKHPAYPNRFMFWTLVLPMFGTCRLASWRRGDPVMIAICCNALGSLDRNPIIIEPQNECWLLTPLKLVVMSQEGCEHV